MLIFLYVYAFIFGTIIASFINVVIYRLPLKITVVKGRSYCSYCHHQLHIMDLIPIMSYILLKGKCRYCHSHISIRDTGVEILGGILALICFEYYGFSWMALLSFVISMIFIAISMIDMDTMIIPDELVIVFLICSILSILWTPYSFFERIIGMLIISIPMLIINSFVESFGGGDIKLIACAGFLLGWQNTVVAMFIAIVIAGLYATFLLLKNRGMKKKYIAFGPYLCLGIFISLLYGERIIEFYLNIFL